MHQLESGGETCCSRTQADLLERKMQLYQRIKRKREQGGNDENRAPNKQEDVKKMPPAD